MEFLIKIYISALSVKNSKKRFISLQRIDKPVFLNITPILALQHTYRYFTHAHNHIIPAVAAMDGSCASVLILELFFNMHACRLRCTQQLVNNVFGILAKEITGNRDRNTPHGHVLDQPIIARYIRIHPVAWYGRICMRVELFGCRKGIFIIASFMIKFMSRRQYISHSR